MKRFPVVLVALLAFVLVGCAAVPVAYAPPAPATVLAGPRVLVEPLVDLRPPEEKSGAGAGLFNKSTKDALFNEPVTTGIRNALVSELRARGVNAVTEGQADYVLGGSVANYRAMIVPPRTAFIPYVSYVTWLWTNDRVSAGVQLDLKLAAAGRTLLQDSYKLKEDTTQWVGVAGLSSTARRMDNNFLVNVLQAGLKDVLTRAATDVRAKVNG